MTLAHHSPFTRQQPIDSPDTEYFSSPSPSPFLDFQLYEDIQEAAAHHPVAQALDLSALDQEANLTSEGLHFMQTPFSSNPRLRVQQSSLQGVDSSEPGLPPMNEGSNWVQSWNSYPEQAYLSPQTPQQFNTPPQDFRTHKRLSSDSSVASTGPDSPYTQSSAYPHIVDTDTTSPHTEAYDTSYAQSQQFDKSFYYQHPNPVSFVNPAFQNLNLSGNEAAVSMMARQNAARGAMAQQNAQNSSMGQRSTRQSTSGYGNMNAPTGLAQNIPNFERTESAVQNDLLYDPSAGQQTSRNFSQGQTLSPHRSVFNDRVHQANTARSTSPSTDMSRERSPFRNDSEFAGQNFSQLPSTAGTSRINSAAQAQQIREQSNKFPEAARAAYMQLQTQSAPQGYGSAPNTISPKEALLDFPNGTDSDHAKLPTLPHSSAHAAQSQFVTANDTSSNAITEKNHGNFNPQNGNATVSSSRRQTPNFPSSQQSTQSNGFAFMAPNNPTTGAAYPFISQGRRQSSSMRSQSDQAPEFPATLTSMESTKSESSREPNIRPPIFGSQETTSSQRSDAASPPSRPADTSAHTNTYVCITPACGARFDTAGKLQKHRKDNHRESHRDTPNRSSTSTASSSTINQQAAANNASRNNAPGPHKCDRINPTTGKPCGTIFSRSYDLTRHEDTIHNNRKQKVRCHLCVEEKTFSRNDALTRHMRVVHPDVDFPNRHRRRG